MVEGGCLIEVICYVISHTVTVLSVSDISKFYECLYAVKLALVTTSIKR